MKAGSSEAPAYKGRPHRPRKARLPVDLWCQVVGSNERAVGQIRNLTTEGCRVVSPSAFPVGGSIRLMVEVDLDVKAQIRWLTMDPSQGLFEIGCQFSHAQDSATRIERILLNVMRQTASTSRRWAPPFAKFAEGLELVGAAAATPLELRKAFAAEGLGRLARRSL